MKRSLAVDGILEKILMNANYEHKCLKVLGIAGIICETH